MNNYVNEDLLEARRRTALHARVKHMYPRPVERNLEDDELDARDAAPMGFLVGTIYGLTIGLIVGALAQPWLVALVRGLWR